MQAKTQVLDLIRGLMVKDIQKFVDWLKTVRVQYSAGGRIGVIVKFLDFSFDDPFVEFVYRQHFNLAHIYFVLDFYNEILAKYDINTSQTSDFSGKKCLKWFKVNFHETYNSKKK